MRILILLMLFGFISCQKEKTTNLDNSLYSKDDNDDDEECCSFRYGVWDTCVDGYQLRSWNSRNACTPPLDSIQRNCESALVRYFYYNPTYTSIRVVNNRAGMINIYNSIGQLSAILPYDAPSCSNCGRWVLVTFLPAGTYTAKTYNRTINFVKQ